MTIILKVRILSALNMLLWLRRIPANDGLTEVYCTLPCAPGVYSTVHCTPEQLGVVLGPGQARTRDNTRLRPPPPGHSDLSVF